jgi:cytidylate kinase
MSFTVAIDGPAAAGKGTISKSVAAHFGFAHLDSGLLYRAVGRRVLGGEEAVAAAQDLTPEDLTTGDLRTPEIAKAASVVAVIPEVRAALLQFQRRFAAQDCGAVIDGRDIGTVICPEAEVKLFVTASAEVRAKRRFDELTGKGIETEFETVLDDVMARDARDRDRASSPMVAAVDAVLIDTTEMSIDDAVARAIAVIEAARRS